MSQYYVPQEYEKDVKIRIPLTPYYLYRCPDNLWMVVEKEKYIPSFGDEDPRIYHYRFL